MSNRNEERRSILNRSMGALLKNLRDLLVYFDGLTNVHQFQQYHANVQGFIHRIDGLLSVSPISRPRDVARLFYEVARDFELFFMDDINVTFAQPTWDKFSACPWARIAINEINDYPVRDPASYGVQLQPVARYKFPLLDPSTFDCKSCLERGHKAAQCQNGVRCKICKQSGRDGWGHITRECQFGICAHCGREGHTHDVCGSIADPPVCLHCLNPGHRKIHCPNPPKCSRCFQYGHVASFCNN